MKIKRYDDRCDQFRQNRLFTSNQKKLFQELEGNKDETPIVPDAERSKHSGVRYGVKVRCTMAKVTGSMI